MKEGELAAGEGKLQPEDRAGASTGGQVRGQARTPTLPQPSQPLAEQGWRPSQGAGGRGEEGEDLDLPGQGIAAFPRAGMLTLVFWKGRP